MATKKEDVPPKTKYPSEEKLSKIDDMYFRQHAITSAVQLISKSPTYRIDVVLVTADAIYNYMKNGELADG